MLCSMSTLSPLTEAPSVRVGAVSSAIAGGRSIRLGSVFLTERGQHHDLTVRTRRTETRPRREARPHVAVVYPDAAALARVQQCLADAGDRTVFRRDGSLWELGFGGTVVHMPDLKGLADIAALLANPGKEIHALDLSAGPAAGLRDDSAIAALDGVEGDLGDVIDAPARAAYRDRLRELLAEIDGARLARDATRLERAEAELAAIRGQLEAAYGLGGRVRRSGDPAERARSAVTARIRSAVRRIESAHPALGRHLRNSLRTGTWCVYAPETPLAWQLT
jgi:hypothetical protein